MRRSVHHLLAPAGLAAACLFGGCGGDDGTGDPAANAQPARVCEVASRPARFGRVRVKGRAWTLPPDVAEVGFALSAGGCSVLVDADRLDLRNARAGVPVKVIGSVKRLTARDVERVLGPDHEPAGPMVRVRHGPPVRVAAGATVIDSFGVVGEDRLIKPVGD
jgi:hypothetical protein